MKPLLRLIPLASLGIATAFPLSATPSGVALEIKPTRGMFPREAQERGITEGWARVAIAVDADGTLLDHIVVAASDQAFVNEASLLLRTAEIAPPREDGRPLALRTRVDITFRNEGLVVISDFQAIADLYLHGRFERAAPVRMVASADLDRLPQPVESIMPSYATDLATRGITGRVVLDFYIDEQGRVRLPAVAAADHPELADLALAALSQWRFTPPTHHGRPVVTHVRQPFDFSMNPPLNATLAPASLPDSS